MAFGIMTVLPMLTQIIKMMELPLLECLKLGEFEASDNPGNSVSIIRSAQLQRLRGSSGLTGLRTPLRYRQPSAMHLAGEKF